LRSVIDIHLYVNETRVIYCIRSTKPPLLKRLFKNNTRDIMHMHWFDSSPFKLSFSSPPTPRGKANHRQAGSRGLCFHRLLLTCLLLALCPSRLSSTTFTHLDQSIQFYPNDSPREAPPPLVYFKGRKQDSFKRPEIHAQTTNILTNSSLTYPTLIYEASSERTNE